jgi:hypothetical protein
MEDKEQLSPHKAKLLEERKELIKQLRSRYTKNRVTYLTSLGKIITQYDVDDVDNLINQLKESNFEIRDVCRNEDVISTDYFRTGKNDWESYVISVVQS